jgi:hypothetical protein
VLQLRNVRKEPRAAHGSALPSAYSRLVAHRKTLNQKQIDVLQWVAQGCPDGVMEDVSHRISAAALRGRGLLRTRGRGATWSAEITDSGREYLRRAAEPDAVRPRQPNVSVVEQLVNDVEAAGGSLRVPRKHWYDRDRVDYEHRARLAERHDKVPRGKWLTATAVNHDELELRLVDAPEEETDAARRLVPVNVPEKVSRYHSAARAFRDRTERHEVSRALLPRATRIVHAVSVEAERRGWDIETPPVREDRYGRSAWTGTKDGHVELATPRETFWFRVREEGVHTRGPWEHEVERYRRVSRHSSFYRDRSYPTGPYDAGATGRLQLELGTGRYWIFRSRQSRWADRQSWERLPHVFREIEGRIIQAIRVDEQERVRREEAAERQRLEAEQRERDWHRLMERARERLLDEHRASHLRAEAERWREAERLRRYCDALAETHRDHPDTAKWLSWARTYVRDLDPLARPPTMPDPPPEKPENLERHLPSGWSAHGPHNGKRPPPRGRSRSRPRQRMNR